MKKMIYYAHFKFQPCQNVQNMHKDFAENNFKIVILWKYVEPYDYHSISNGMVTYEPYVWIGSYCEPKQPCVSCKQVAVFEAFALPLALVISSLNAD